jgi:hypothetical protein
MLAADLVRVSFEREMIHWFLALPIGVAIGRVLTGRSQQARLATAFYHMECSRSRLAAEEAGLPMFVGEPEAHAE